MERCVACLVNNTEHKQLFRKKNRILNRSRNIIRNNPNLIKSPNRSALVRGLVGDGGLSEGS